MPEKGDTHFSDKLRLKETAEEDIYFARRDRELIRALHEKKQAEQQHDDADEENRSASPKKEKNSLSAEIFFYRYLLNPVMRGLLRSPLHGLASANIAILHFKGRQSGRSLNTPLSYMREGNTVRLLSSTSTRWWKNLRNGPVAVEIDIRGSRLAGSATLYEGDSESARDGVRKFIAAVPRDARVYGLELDRDKQLLESSLAANISELILVEIELD